MANENSATQFTITPLDFDGEPFTPSTARYRLDDKATSTELIAWTVLTVDDEMEITIPASAHAMQNATLAEETKVLTVEINYGLDTAHVEEFEYVLFNKQFVS